ncbi:major histocompatibility complex class I-related gene protein-like isoform X1 [Parambassis ranga]|uniref:Major histocompatibility complex class I-related gene protein-like isoform X1 n=1 Tax=Parambassis ranga TaxID=210632 RepID=A0A6P7HKK8_9TELE|nr:major histocompatibility complex class I-related gene protein-like isoform X1 [Parambassis ranga]XP_028256118.1 major histocompatibility complex class I-related gene protein-like isoform X1 [Parambassis ranga]XP_028256119.1 major histocompatibility complex class I-related gene protein-like isoform X1 [Parambassis ranga]XP_028256120.1 major histocompatibility complex class I-related gene protein-like isoform X1 [Parambassis ranga]XP_028256121.1 major histocompatibility complex class I-related
MKNQMCLFFLLFLFCHISSAVKHSFKCYRTASSGLQNVSEFMFFGKVDDVEVNQCDSTNKIFKPKQDWVVKLYNEDPEVLQAGRQECFVIIPFFFKHVIYNLTRTLQTEGAILQCIPGCELDETTGQFSGFVHCGYNGEDFLRLDLKTLKWIALSPQASIVKQIWDRNTTIIEYYKDLINHRFPYLLQRFLEYGRSSLMRTDPPSVSLLQKTPSSAVSCHATGFYPDRALMFWSKDGEEIHEGVEHGEILPNHDGTFQMSVDLNVSSAEDWRRYNCVFQFVGAVDRIITELDGTLIRTNRVKPDNLTVPVIAAVVVVVVMATAGGYMAYKMKKEAEDSTEPREDTNLNTETNTAH